MAGLPTGALLLAGAPNRASTADIVEPRCGVSTPDALMASWPSTARVSANAGDRAPSANATTVIFNVRASMVFSYGRRHDRGGNIRPAVAKSAAVAMHRLSLTALL